MIKYLVFDFANTLVGKPNLYSSIKNLLDEEGISLDELKISTTHRTLVEATNFPDLTTRDFYRDFNEKFLFALGVNPSEVLLNKLHERISVQKWEPFPDTNFLTNIDIPMAILSNWDESLTQKVELLFPHKFSKIIGSASTGLRKPNVEFYTFLLKELGCAEGDVLYIGDSFKLDILPASLVGINSLLIDRENFYQANGFKKINSLEELAQYLN